MQNEGAYSESHRQISVGYSARILDLEVQIRDGRNPPTLLSLTAGQDSCCIFRVPPSLVDINRKAYQPHIVSIGPFYHGGRQFLMIQQHKLRFLGDLLARNRRVSISNLFMTISAMEESIRRSYSETLKFNSPELIEMMVLDLLAVANLLLMLCLVSNFLSLNQFRCFIIELFFRAAKKAPFDPSDPLFNVQWVLPCLLRDLLRIENQIPYSVLQALFSLCDANANGTSLAGLALMSFNYMFQRPTRVLEKYYDREGKHLLDLFRQTFVLASQFSSEVPSVSPPCWCQV
ncbi:hypothetical protein SAY86_002078 [Trapa natans]|uniref:Uncharacterized protein n=1 Tax=Trapa natans TaxID=22666 RepID=A0AAN7QZ82_TRANT|nr:hypothetical protein SAY86_002078 [Trapa natans]